MPVGAEPLVRLAIFLVVFAALALWERSSPARALSLPRAVRWQANLGLALVNVLAVRLIIPGSAIAVAALAADESWGLFNRLSVRGWMSIALSMLLI